MSKDYKHKDFSYAVWKSLIAESEDKLITSLGKNKMGNSKLFDLGRDCFFNPELMKGLSEEVLGDKSFLNGYEHGKRLTIIEELEKKNGKTK